MNPRRLVSQRRSQRMVEARRDRRPTVAIIASIAYSLPNFRGPLIRDFVAAGWRVLALAPDYDPSTRAAVASLGAEPLDCALERAGMRPLVDVAHAVQLARQLRELRPDLVFSYFIKPVIYGSIAAWAARVPRRFALVAGLGYVFTANGDENTPKRRLLRAAASGLYWLGFKACRRVFFQNQDDIDQFVGAGLLPARKAFRLAGSGVDLSRLPPAAPVTQPVTFLLMARLLREKGIAEYVEAARMIRADHPQARFLLLGGADPNPGGLTLDQVRNWTADGTIEWLGHVDDVRPILASCSVFVLPSYREGMPRSTQEAMAMAKPIVSTDVPGCRDTVEQGVNGYLVPARDSRALAAAMRRFVDDPSLIAPLGAASRRLAEEKYDVNRINRVILDVLDVASAVHQ
jgi:glycosyltransferase involved in cell wall biosynthesis